MTHYSFSVIIPTYNRRRFLERSIHSVITQTIQPREIIVVDDGSTDGSAEWIRLQYPQVKVIQQENKGVSAARNHGIQIAQAEWIAFLDSDDEWLPNKLENQQQALDDNPDFKFCHGEDIWMRNNVFVNAPKHYAKPEGWAFKQCLPRCVISPSAVVIHKTVFEHVGLFNENLPACEDYDLWLRISVHYPLLLIKDPVSIKYDGHDDQLSNQRGLDFYRIKALENIMQEDLSAVDRQAAQTVFEKKCQVYLNGARKHGNEEGKQAITQLMSQP